MVSHASTRRLEHELIEKCIMECETNDPPSLKSSLILSRSSELIRQRQSSSR